MSACMCATKCSGMRTRLRKCETNEWFAPYICIKTINALILKTNWRDFQNNDTSMKNIEHRLEKKCIRKNCSCVVFFAKHISHYHTCEIGNELKIDFSSI